MRRRLQRFLPLMLIALVAQIFAPIAASRAFAINVSDPLGYIQICHGNAGGNSGQTNDPVDHDGTCTICCTFLAAATPLGAQPVLGLAAPRRNVVKVIWQPLFGGVLPARTGSNSQARAPPQAV